MFTDRYVCIFTILRHNIISNIYTDQFLNVYLESYQGKNTHIIPKIDQIVLKQFTIRYLSHTC